MNTKPTFRNLIGLTLEEAQKRIKDAGYSWRLSSTNGEPLLLTCDLNPSRVNLDVDEFGNVANVSIG